MSAAQPIQQAPTTTVVGYYNPQRFSIYIEISEINLKTELAPNAYIRDRTGRYINDPIFEPYCHPKGLARATGDKPLPIYYVPRFVKSERPAAAVTQATAFVRQPDGRTVPSYAKTTAPPREPAVSTRPYAGMSMAEARKRGLVGNQTRLVPEDYGGEESTGAPAKGIPSIKYSLESPPKIKSASVLRPELMEADADLSPEEKSRRLQLQTSLNQAASLSSPENFNPATVRPGGQPTPAPAAAIPVAATQAPKAKTKGVEVKPVEPTAPQRQVRVARPIEQPEAQEPEAQEPTPEMEAGSGIVEPLDESSMPEPVPQAPPATERGRRFVCAADGKAFEYRSQLERHVKRVYADNPAMIETLMAPYPPT